MDVHFITNCAFVCHWIPVGNGSFHRACHNADDIELIRVLLASVHLLSDYLSVAAAIGIPSFNFMMLTIFAHLLPRIANQPVIASAISVGQALNCLVVFLFIIDIS